MRDEMKQIEIKEHMESVQYLCEDDINFYSIVKINTGYMSVGDDLTGEITHIPFTFKRCVNCGGRCNIELACE